MKTPTKSITTQLESKNVNYKNYTPSKTVINHSSVTRQEFKKDCDINEILKTYKLTGKLYQTMQNPEYGDFSATQSYIDALDIVHKAEIQFNSLSASLRDRFKNSPAALLDFVNNASEADLETIGLIEKTPAAPAAGVPPAGAGGQAPGGATTPTP